MIGDVPNNEKKKPVSVEEVLDDDDRRSITDSTGILALSHCTPHVLMIILSPVRYY